MTWSEVNISGQHHNHHHCCDFFGENQEGGCKVSRCPFSHVHNPLAVVSWGTWLGTFMIRLLDDTPTSNDDDLFTITIMSIMMIMWMMMMIYLTELGSQHIANIVTWGRTISSQVLTRCWIKRLAKIFSCQKNKARFPQLVSKFWQSVSWWWQ